MAKIKHNNFINTVDEVITAAKEKGVVHLYAQEDFMVNGRSLKINGNDTLHFGTCGYLSFEHHPRVKEAAIKAIEQYGTQFPMSKTYISNPLYSELEALIEQMYQAPVVISKNCTLAHLATIPIIVGENDAIILDHQVHASIQEVAQKMLTKGVHVEMVRHNNLEMLEEKVMNLKSKYEKIWFMSDGVYSMYGDFAPIKELIALADKHEQLYLYVDDAHGMSWAGKHGSGYVMSQMEQLHEKMILTATLGKGFGSCGGVSVFPNKEWQRRVKTFGGPNTFSVQLEPPILGAAVASARIHLGDEIYPLQEELQRRINYCNSLIKATDLPLVAETNSPVFFIGTGVMGMTNHFVHDMIEDGVYINPALFPAVPMKNNGARFTISLNNQYEDIEMLVDKMEEHFLTSMISTGQTQEKIRKAFKLPLLEEKKDDLNEILTSSSINTRLGELDEINLEVFPSVVNIDKNDWNNYLGHKGMFDWEGMKLLETSYQQNEKAEENWDFRYFQVKDTSGKVLLMTFCIIGLWKEDTFSKASISKQIEEIRVNDPYYLTSKSIVMGSLATEGDHMYLDRSNANWRKILFRLIDELYHEQEVAGAGNVILRDFHENDTEFMNYMMELGFVKVDMPESCVLENMDWKTEEEFKGILSKSSRKHFREEIKKYEGYFNTQVLQSLDEEQLQHAWELFLNVKNKNLGLNTFAPPRKLFEEINNNDDWEFVVLKLNPEYSDYDLPVAVVLNHKNSDDVYSLVFIGMDYERIYPYRGYLQALYQCVLHAKERGCRKINFGISAITEKKKIGATIYPKVAYFYAKDNFNMEMMSRTMLVTDH